MTDATLKNLPLTLAKQKRWINFRTEKLKTGKLTKIPCDAQGRNTSVTDIKNLRNFKDVCETLKTKPAFGVGYVFNYGESATVHVGIDFDNCVEDPKLFKKVLSLVKRFNSYAEYSLSGKGIHIIGKLEAPYRLEKNKFKVPIESARKLLEIEVYNDKRFFACTGKVLEGFEALRIEIIDEPLEILLTDLHTLSGIKKKEQVDVADKAPLIKKRSPKLKDEEILGLIAASKQSVAFSKMHHDGDLDDFHDDHSRAVMSWHSIVAFYTQKIKQIDRLFRNSALYGDKWADKEDGGADKWERLRKTQHKQIISTLTTFYGLTKIPDKYVELLIEEFGAPRRDIFTEDLFVFHEERWKNVFDEKIEYHLKSICNNKGTEYKITHLVPALYRYHHSLNPRFLLDIPEWDGIDRIKCMSECLTFEEEAITGDVFEDLAKDWGSKAFQRIHNPHIQNHCMILNGGQDIGKDTFWETFTNGFKEYQANLTTRGKFTSEKDLAEIIVPMAVIIISEFDSLKELNPGMLKNLITTPFFNTRMAFGRKAGRYYNRASFLACCNPEDMLRDATGNRRFWVFKLKGVKEEAIRWDYDRTENASTQILAQFKLLAQKPYTASEDSLKIMSKLIAQYTPDDANDIILEHFDEAINHKLLESNKKAAIFRNTEISFIIKDIAKFLGTTPMQILSVLKAKKRHYKYTGAGAGKGNWYGLKEHTQDKGYRSGLRKEACKKLKDSSSSLSLVEPS